MWREMNDLDKQQYNDDFLHDKVQIVYLEGLPVALNKLYSLLHRPQNAIIINNSVSSSLSSFNITSQTVTQPSRHQHKEFVVCMPKESI